MKINVIVFGIFCTCWIHVVTSDTTAAYDHDTENPEIVPRGPKLTLQPVDTIMKENPVNASLFCEADAYPPADYQWYTERGGEMMPIDPNEDDKYTVINGQLIIHEPNKEDTGYYQCAASNHFGSILSNKATLKFGYLMDFPNSPREPFMAIEYFWASIDCQPPAHYPDLVYTWFKDREIVEAKDKPHTMTSNDGRLYFSEVTAADAGHYECMVQIPGIAAPKTSLPIELQIYPGNPGIYEPNIGSGFPSVYPRTPMLGGSVRIECWASGTAAPGVKLEYKWQKVLLNDKGEVIQILPLPAQSVIIDNGRVLLLPDARLSDAGHYSCTARRTEGQSTNKTITLVMDSYPYFILSLKDQFIDANTPLTWRCTAGGDPNYFWLRDGQALDNSTIPAEDRDRISINENVLQFAYVDPKDAGMYQCSAQNTHGTRHSSAELRVLLST